MTRRPIRSARRAGAVLCAAAVAVLCLAACDVEQHTSPPPEVDAPLQVDTTSGRLQGATVSTATGAARTFLGVRYARPPVGALRFAPPEPATAAGGVVDATRPGSPCAQQGTAPGADATGSTDEDCLFLNVTTPARVPSAGKLPVMVWWHGGGFTSGSGASYDATRLADGGDVVVVTVNYRLGIFGYLGLPGLDGGGDFGLADQILATRWAKQNAAAFGGDPDDITVFGESAGAMSACALLTSPAAHGLVQKVAMSSGSCGLDWPTNGLFPGLPASTPYVAAADSASFGASEAAGLGCSGADTLDCLRALPTSTLLAVSADFANALAYGTSLLPDDPAGAVRAGEVAPGVGVMSGGNANEEAAFIGGYSLADPTALTAATVPALLEQAFPGHSADVLATYPLPGFPSPAAAYAQIMTDAGWACPTLRVNRELAGHGTTVHAYQFGPSDPPDVNGAAMSDVPQTGAHAGDTAYLFDLGGTSALTTSARQRLAAAMVDYWTSFARTGTPTGNGLPSWDEFGADDTTVQSLADTIGPVDVASSHHCGLWADVRS